MAPSHTFPRRPMRDVRLLWALSALALAACAGDDARAARVPLRSSRPARVAVGEPDTAVYVARQAGEAVSPSSGVMQLRVVGRDAQVTLENALGQLAVAGAPNAELVQQIPGSRAVTTAQQPDSASGVTGWHASVTAPVLVGEHYLVELFPSSPREDSASLDLSADDRRLTSARVPLDATMGAPALFEVVINDRSISVGPQIEGVDVVPTCGTAHLVRSGSLADLYAQFEVIETGEHGDIHLPPREADAKYRSVGFHTLSRGGVRILYLGHLLATAAIPEGCPAS